jgi:endogenous inhibitor of DNA gyrase (YacG/DUF329 family)
MTAEQRPCLHCGTTFTWTPASPRKRFCSQPCRLAWWGQQRRGTPRPRRRTRNPAPPAATPGQHTNDVAHPPATLAATPACPHCQRPVAIVAWLVPPAAASVTTPPRTPAHAATRPTASDNQ